MTVIVECPYCNGNRIGCDYCDESGLMTLDEIDRIERMQQQDKNEEE